MLGRVPVTIALLWFTLLTPAPVAAAPLRVGIEPNTAPLSTNSPTEPPAGFAVDLMRAVATADAVLRHHGYTTVLAVDGHEAVKSFRARPQGFAAVLLDLTMPGLNGAEVLRELRAINPHVRVLIMSGYSEHDISTRLRGQGEVPIIHKPFTQETLLARLAAVTG